MKKFPVLVIVVLLLVSSCTSSKKSSFSSKIHIKDTNSLDVLMEQFAHNIENIWGFNEVLIDVSSPKNYIKYTNDYKNRIYINFDKGIITIETIADSNSLAHLRQTIIKTLLAVNNPDFFNIYFNNKGIQISNRPFSYNQIVDQKGQPIRCKEHARNFANYLLKTCIKKRNNGLNIIYGVTINLVSNNIDDQTCKYINLVRKASQKYNIEESLILAIIQTESSFNPYAVSRSDALGLMQIVQNTAGKDVFQAQGKSGTPSRNYLFDPESNIDTGTAYLAMLNNIYLNGICNPTSRQYAVITAYNSGAGSVLRVFSNDKVQAESIINSMSPKDVYITLTTRHPSVESRRYLYKVHTAQKSYYKK